MLICHEGLPQLTCTLQRILNDFFFWSLFFIKFWCLHADLQVKFTGSQPFEI